MRMQARKSMPKKKKQIAAVAGGGDGNMIPDGGVLVDAGQRPLAFEDVSAYKTSGHKAMPGNYITGNKKHFR